jgi:2-methylcitrate dehydratase PrpD
MGTTERLAEFVVNTNFDAMPEAAVNIAKRQILDTVGVALLAYDEPASNIAIKYIRTLAAKPKARVLGYGFKTSSPDVAFVDGIMAHGLDFDDIGGYDHPSCVLTPAVLALGEEVNASGQDIIEAFILGFEVGTKAFSAYAMPVSSTSTGGSLHDRGFHGTGIFGAIATTAAAAKILGLDVKQTRNAFGIAAAQAAGIYQNTGSMANPLTIGNAARAGIISATLAKQGFTGDDTILEAEFGFLRAFSGEAGYDLRKVTENLGNPYTLVTPGPGLKAYPCCAGTHAAIDAALQIRNEGHITPDQIAQIDCIEADCHARMLTAHPNPRTGLEAKFNTPFTIVMALFYGEVNQSQFNETMLFKPSTQELLKKVKHTPKNNKSDPQVVNIRLRDGRSFSTSISKHTGAVGTLIPDEAVYRKYVRNASKALSANAVESSLDTLKNLEKVGHIKELIDQVIVSTKK